MIYLPLPQLLCVCVAFAFMCVAILKVRVPKEDPRVVRFRESIEG